MIRDINVRSIDTLAVDIIAAARLTGAAYSEPTIRRVLQAFEDGFVRRSVQLRTTTHPPGQRDLCFRYLDLAGGRHPLEIAVERGELTLGEHPKYAWLPRNEERLGVLGHGVDFEASHGLAKIWTFLPGAYDPRAFLEVPLVPRGLRASVPLLRRLHLDSATIIGVDYVRESINLYFRPSHASHQGPELLAHLCEALRFARPSDAALAHASRAGCIGVTYGWNSPDIERVCFYVAGHTRAEVPNYDPLLRTYAEQAPALVDDPRFIVGWSHGRSGSYFKLEDDYTGDVSDVFAVAMGVPRVPHVAAASRSAPTLQVPGP